MKGKSNGHRRALVESTGDRDVPVVCFCNPLGDRQTKSGPTHCRWTAPPNTIGSLDDMRKIRFGNSQPVVGDHDLHLMLRGVQSNDNRAVFPSVFDGIVRENHEELHEPLWIPLDRRLA